MKLKIKCVFTEECLGTKAIKPEVFAEYIGRCHPDGDVPKDEMEAAIATAKAKMKTDDEDGAKETNPTVFHVVDGKPVIYDYQLKGFFKEACGAMNRMDSDSRVDRTGKELEKLTAFKTKIVGLVFPAPRIITLHMPEGVVAGVCVRPLIGDTPQGKRIAIGVSETMPVGTWFEAEIDILDKSLLRYVMFWLDYGNRIGLGQWRGSGKGRFTWENITAVK